MAGAVLAALFVALLGLAKPSALEKAVLADLTPAERWVASCVAAGKVADFSQAPAETLGMHQLRAPFLEALLTGAAGLDVHHSGVFLVGADIEGALDLSYADVAPAVFLVQCRFDSAVVLTGTRFARTLVFERATFQGPAKLHRLRVAEDAYFGGSTFHDEADFLGADVSGRLGLQGAVFLGKTSPSFRSMRIGLGLSMTGAKFSSGADFTDARIEGDLQLEAVVFEHATLPALFRGARIGGDGLFARTRFNGPADFTGMQATGLMFESARFESPDQPAKFTAVHVERNAFFTGVTLRAGIALAGAHLGSLLLDGNAEAPPIWPVVVLDAAVIDHHMALGAATIGSWEATRMHVQGALILKNLHIRAKVDLRDVEVGALKLLEVRWPVQAEQVWLEGLKWSTASAGEGREDWRKLLNWLTGARFDVGVYTQLDSQLRNGGHGEEADQVYIQGQRRDNARRGLLKRWATLVFWDGLTGYGKMPGRTVWVSLTIILLGSFVFDPKQFDPNLLMSWRWLSPQSRLRGVVLRILLSMNQFLPGIDLGLSKLWELSRVSFLTLLYFHFHKLCGWILIPVGLAAIYSQFR